MRIPRSLVAPLLLIAPLVPTLAPASAPAAAPSSPAPRIPLCLGLRVVTAIAQPVGDYESVKTVNGTDAEGITVQVSGEIPQNGAVERIRVVRRVSWKDLGDATFYHRVFYNRAALSIPGSTGLGTSRAVLRALRTTGHAELGLVDDTYATSTADSTVHPNIYDYRTTATIERVGSTPVMVPVLVNGARVELPAIAARGDYIDEKAELLFLDDDDNPLTLRYRIGGDALDVVQIRFDCSPVASAGPTVQNRIEQALLATGRADVYSIFFAFNSADLRQESDSTLHEIDEVLRRHPDWKLAINGHTDNVGGDAYNLGLSERRAAAVKSALVARFGAAPARLTTAGYGERQPKATNTTLEGRAENRRVELVRLP